MQHSLNTDLASLVARRAESAPDSPALWVNDTKYSYHTLWQTSGYIAARLARLPGRYIGLSARKEFLTYAALIGILRAGKTYVPVAEDEPGVRSAALLKEVGCRYVLDTQSEAWQASGLRPLPLADYAVPIAEPGCEAPESDRPGTTEAQMALLFTSGSTGTPKGVALTRDGFVSYLSAAAPLYLCQSDDKVAQLAPLTFDFSLHDMGVAWGAGACLYAIDKTQGFRLPQFIATHGITVFSCVPSAFLMLDTLGSLAPNQYPALRRVIFGGETVPMGLMKSCRLACPEALFFNIYGPTEATIAVAVSRWDDAYFSLDDYPLGAPLAGNQVQILDAQQRPVDEGEVGEIWLSGAQLSPGYVLASEVDQQRFVCQQGVNWYRTGDFGVWDARWGLRFRGRRDAQWKVRGCRVEQSDAEERLREVAQTQNVAMLARRDASGLVCALVAFVEDSALTPAEIRKRCHRFMPEYMFPQHIFYAPIPKNRNMKTDYPALAAMMQQRLDTAGKRQTRKQDAVEMG